MGTTTQPIPLTRSTSQPAALSRPRRCPAAHTLAILAFWAAIFLASLASPPLLDDADATHAQAAQAIADTGDLITLHVNGLRYLEKAPLPYWLAAISLHSLTTPRTLATRAAFAIHLPLALSVLALALLGYAWSHRAFGQRAALYTALMTLTATGVFLFTRIFIPDALLSLLLAAALYTFLRALTDADSSGAPSVAASSSRLGSSGSQTIFPHLMWLALALAVLTKGLVALVLFFGAALLFSLITQSTVPWRRLAPVTGPLLFLAVAAPWHILAGLRNTGGAQGHGFFWFYFVNEHILRFLGQRTPRDYNKLPTLLYWSLHIVWLFPWSLFAPAAIARAWRSRSDLRTPDFATRTVVLLASFSALLLVFFSLSTNQEYYTFPAYLPLLTLLAAALAQPDADPRIHRLTTWGYTTFVVLGLAISAALVYGLWTSRRLPYLPDIGSVLAHRGVGDYTLSMSHFFDLTGPSFAALRLPATLAAIAFAVGPVLACRFHATRHAQPALLTVALTSAVFLIAAHIALVRFAPMLSSQNFAATIQNLQQQRRIAPDTEVLLYGDQAFGSSVPFYLHQRVLLVEGRSTSMLFGSTFPDAPHLFLAQHDLLAQWGTGPRKLLFVPLEQRNTVDALLGPHQFLIQETSGKALLTDRPLH